ncbi:2,5-diamino-6-(ribosylamino)-4(3H)-pyrimidinone 5'-phosphate reductase [Rhizoclosmatium sp. JEL0117]|nr:2,5-diamino-6-(ribosylamino)-4(3H)-pyrimidinone 5'-phosphate reductase [Rhizoclosmatium sp. JEL0117]
MDFIKPVFDAALAAHTDHTRPFSVLTFAQSLDGCIGSADNSQPLRLSGTESMSLTHSLRHLCDGILVGSGTLVNDNPRLNVRPELLVSSDSTAVLSSAPSHPRPIILDSNLRTPPTANIVLLKNRPIIVCSFNPSSTHSSDILKRQSDLEAVDVQILNLEGVSLHDNIPRILTTLKSVYNINSLMIEGGSHVISSFLTLGSNAVDLLVVTVAPMFVGINGVKANDGNSIVTLSDPTYKQFGRDMVLVSKLP